MTTENIDPGQGYRLLTVGEKKQEGDEYWCPNDRQWEVCGCPVGSVLRNGFDFTHRRKLAQPDFRWIPVTEKLPERYQTVFTTDRACPGGLCQHEARSDFLKDDGVWLSGKQVTFWLLPPPLLKPEPTREDRQVEAFERAISAKLSDSHLRVDCKLSFIADAFRKALAVT